jgi:hypothetical protein
MHVQVSTTVMTDFFDVIPDLAIAEVVCTLKTASLVLANSFMQQQGELSQVYPMLLLSRNKTRGTGFMLDVWLASSIHSLSVRQIGLTNTVCAVNENVYFGH